jgi:predicted RNA-binding Zn ribbon-like protein
MQSAPEKQPGGRAPAPGDLALVQAFINSNYSLEEHNHGAELLDSPAGLKRWFEKRDLRDGGNVGLEQALAVREGLRALLVAKRSDQPDERAIEELNTIAGARRLSVRLQLDGPRFESRDDPLALILALAAQSMLDGTWARLKACKECCWAFYDHSKNGAGSWCSMKVCGGRVKQRAYYERSKR